VYGAYRRLSSSNFWRLNYLGIFNDINLIPTDTTDSSSIANALKSANPNEVYHLAAQSFVHVSFNQPIYTTEATGISTVRMLEEIRKVNPKIKFYQASSSEIFGNEKTFHKNESTPFHPASPYAIAKLYSHWFVNLYREAYKMFAVSGILFNHESPIRGLEFVTRKVSNGVAKISLGMEKSLKLGNFSARRDWGYAPEYVSGMWKMIQQNKPDDCVLATGESHSVKELAEEACKIAGISSKNYCS